MSRLTRFLLGTLLRHFRKRICEFQRQWDLRFYLLINIFVPALFNKVLTKTFSNSVALKPYYIALKHYIYIRCNVPISPVQYRFHQKSVIIDRFADLFRFPRNQISEHRNFNVMQRHSRYVNINRHSLTIIHDKDP